MEDYIGIFIIIGISVFFGMISFIAWVKETISDSKKYIELKPKLDDLENLTREHKLRVEKDKKEWKLKVEQWNGKIQNKNREIREVINLKKEQLKEEIEKKYKEIQKEQSKNEECLKLETKQLNERIEKDKEEVEKIAKQKSMGFPWLSDAYAEYFSLRDFQQEDYLRSKKHPAFTAAEVVQKIRWEKRKLLKENKIIGYKINYFEKLFPWLSELIAEDEDEEIPVRIDDNNLENEDGDSKDRVKDYLTQEEYRSLPSVKIKEIKWHWIGI